MYVADRSFSMSERGIAPCSVHASQTANSTWSQRSYLLRSDQTAPIRGLVYRSITVRSAYLDFRPCRYSSYAARTESCLMPSICAARNAAFRAPQEPMATHATGMPGGIWAME